MPEAIQPAANQWPTKLPEGQSPEELVLALPGMGEDELRYTIDASQAIDRVTRELSVKFGKTAVRLVFPKVGSFVVDAYEIGELVAGSDLFDRTMAHMLTTVGDALTVEAGRVLREAMAEPAVEDKNQLRNRAATMLHESL